MTEDGVRKAVVISGAIESKVSNGETRIYREDESWSEPPNASHSTSRAILLHSAPRHSHPIIRNHRNALI